jgi:photosystem II stability/assembly factor-like uncharacterized protein
MNPESIRKRLPIAGFLLSFFFLLFSVPALAGTNRWTTTGPYGGAITLVAIDPSSPDTLYAAIGGGALYDNYGAGVFKSTDGGVTWMPMGRGVEEASPVALVVDPKTPSNLYMAASFKWSNAGGIFKSVDGGATWTSCYDGAYDIILDPQTPSTLYAGQLDLLKSTDGGATWVHLALGNNIDRLAMDSQTPSILYSGAEGYGVGKSTDGGVTWSFTAPGFEHKVFDDLVVDPSDPSTLFVSAAIPVEGGHLYKSTDGGATFTELQGGPPIGIRFSNIVVDPLSSSTLYACAYDNYRGLCGGLYKSTDGGLSWAEANNGLDTPAVVAISIDPRNPSTLYASTFAGVYKSTDAGASWFPSNSGLPFQWGYSLAIDPQSPSKRYLATIGGIYKSTDSGASWQWSSDGLQGWAASIIVLDPQNSRTLYACALKQGVFQYPTQMFKSTDEGKSWAPLNLDDCEVYTIVVSPTDSSKIFVGAGGLFRSDDGGETWIRRIPIPIAWIYSLAVDPSDPTIVYAGGSYGLAKSTDGGETWFRIAPDLINFHFGSILFDPVRPHTIYFSGYRTDSNVGAIFRSTDGGATCELIGSTLGIVPTNIVVDPTFPATLFAGSLDGYGVFATQLDDIGWWEVNHGWGRPNSVFLALDPERPRTLCAAAGGIPIQLGGLLGNSTNGTTNGVYYYTVLDVPPPVLLTVKGGVSPYRLTLKGSNFHPSAKVLIDGNPAPVTIFKNGLTLVAKGGAALKAMLPKGKTVQITVENEDDAGVSEPVSFKR